MKIYGTWHVFLIEQLAEEEDVSGFLTAIVEEYQNHGNVATIQLALQYVVEAHGEIAELARKIEIEPEVLTAMLDDAETPNIDTLNIVLGALGCCLPIGSLETANTPIAVATEGTAVVPESRNP